MKMNNFAIRITAAALAAVAAMTCTSVSAFAAGSDNYYTSVDALSGIEFSSFEELAEFVKENSGKSVIKGIEKEVSDFLLSSDGIYIPAAYADKITEIDSILITPTYVSTTVIIKNVRCSFYHYFDNKAGETKLEDAKRYYKEKRNSANHIKWLYDTYYYELLEEWYYAWEQEGEVFVLRVGSSEFEDGNTALCSVVKLPFESGEYEGGFIKSEDGTRYIMADGSYAKGWLEIDGKTYYFSKGNGFMATKNSSIKGVRYKFTSDGVCQGKFTGWEKKNGKRYYYSEGKTLRNWQKIKDKWYYFKADGSAVTGKNNLFGKKLTFSGTGVWNGEVPGTDWYSVYLAAKKNIKSDNYAYYSVDKGMFILHLKDSKALDKNLLSDFKRIYPAIQVDEVKFSAKELTAVKKTLDKNRNKFGFSDCWTDYDNNCIQVTAKKINSSFKKYLDSLKDSDIINVTIDEIVSVDD